MTALTPKDHTLQFTDVFSTRRHNLQTHHAPHRAYLTYNSRGALYQLLSALPQNAGNTILLPAFHCVALVDPVVAAGFKAVFYRIRQDLTIDIEDFASKLKPGVAATVVVHFFGFPADLDDIAMLSHEHGSYLIEDCAHSFLSRSGDETIGRRGDFAIFSYYKFAPSLVGGSLVVNRKNLRLELPNARLPLHKQVVIVKRLFTQALMNTSDNPLSSALLRLDHFRINRRNQRNSERTYNKTVVAETPSSSTTLPSAFLNDPFLFDEALARSAMPWISKRIVESSKWQEIANKRRQNYLLLSRLLPDTGVLRRMLPDLPEGVVPWFYPVSLSNRTNHQRALRKLGIPLSLFGVPLHSALNDSNEHTCEDARALSRDLMLLPVHHLLGEDQIQTYVKTLLDYVDSQHGARNKHKAPLHNSEYDR